MAHESYKYSAEYRDRFGFNGADIHWMQEAFDLFSKKASKEMEQLEKDGKNPLFSKEFFPMMFEEILSKAKHWTTPPKTYPDHEYE